jgi:short-subunit dehydrogenase
MKTIIVTGASAGIGRALAKQAARAGYSVVGVARRPDALAQLANDVRAAGGAIETMAADVSDVRTAPAIVTRALDRFGRIDVVVNNAGFVAAGDLSAQPDAAVAAQFATHVFGPLALTRHALPALRRSNGQVFFLGSGVARVPVGDLGAYPASKAAIRSAAATIRRELARDGVAVTYVDPGAVDTDFMRRAGMPGAPARLLVSPEDVARKILRAVETRPRTLNAVPWQTLIVALAELFPRVTDEFLTRAPNVVGGGQVAPPLAPAAPLAAAPQPSPAPTRGGLAGALAPVAARMERLKMREDFVRSLLVPGATLELGEVAMRWAGMPNKNERAGTAEVLEVLERAGYLEPAGEQTWKVARPGD